MRKEPIYSKTIQVYTIKYSSVLNGEISEHIASMYGKMADNAAIKHAIEIAEGEIRSRNALALGKVNKRNERFIGLVSLKRAYMQYEYTASEFVNSMEKHCNYISADVYLIGGKKE